MAEKLIFFTDAFTTPCETSVILWLYQTEVAQVYLVVCHCCMISLCCVVFIAFEFGIDVG
ncbi:hypothetical protein [Sideroxydans sp. CL21]|nr:hypothetical protein [Sideroxydans sp. CL21]